MLTRMQNLDDVTDVQLAKSARKDERTGWWRPPWRTAGLGRSRGGSGLRGRCAHHQVRATGRVRRGSQRSPAAAAGDGNPRAPRLRSALHAAAAQGAAAAPAAGGTPMTQRDRYILSSQGRRRRRLLVPGPLAKARAASRSTKTSRLPGRRSPSRSRRSFSSRRRRSSSRALREPRTARKAVPADEDDPSLLVQLNHAAARPTSTSARSS